MSEVLVAGVGNLFLGDDGFGCEVARRIASRGVPSGVIVRDFGIRTMDLMLALERAERAIVVDVLARGGEPGTLHVLEPSAGPSGPALLSPHAATVTDVLAWAAARRDRGLLPRVLRMVGCEPATFGDEDDGGAIGLSAPVLAAVGPAAALVTELATLLRGGVECTSSA